MEFPEEGKASAKKFLEYFLSKNSYPSSVEEPLPVVPPQTNGRGVRECEVEAECMNMCRNFLARCSCPGLLNYNITCVAVQELMSGPLDDYQLKKDAGDEDGGEGGGGGAESEKLYDEKLLALATVQATHKLCQRWAETLGPLSCPRSRPNLSISAMKNTRRKMEDRHSVCLDINTLYGLKDLDYDQTFFGVYDGHVGAEAADYCSRHIHHNIIRHPSFISDPVLAIKEGIKQTDERFCETGFKSGSTAVVALLRGSKLYIGWVGDSQAVLVRKGEAVQIMNPHKPDREDEQQRIEAAGGLVINIGVWRVNGNLSVSRAVGDPKDKKYVIGDAEVSEIQLDGTEDYLVVACDGIWDVVDGEELTSHLKGYFLKRGTKNDSAKSLVDFARSEGSGDNLTAIIVFFSSFEIPSPTETKTGTETTSVKTETGSTKTETGSTKTETGSTKTETGSTKTETGSTETETGSTKTETGSTEAETSSTKTETGSTETETGTSSTGNPSGSV